MTEAERYGLLINILVPIVSAVGAAWVSFRVAKNQIDGDRMIFLSQIASDAQAERDKENIKNNNKLTNFSWLLDKIVKYASKQSEDYLKVAKGVEANKLGQHMLISRASSDIVRILSINQEEIFLALIAKAKDTAEDRERIGKIYSKLDYIKGIIDDAKFQFEGYHVTVHGILSDYRQHIENVREAISDTMEKIRKGNMPLFAADPLWIFLNDALGNYSQNMPKGAGIDWHHPNFLRPVQEHLARNFLRDERTQKIMFEGRRASILAGRIIHDAESIVETLQAYSKALDEVLKELAKERDFINALLVSA
jgi:uncharacterized protein YbgA (DUF1722 family)